MRFCITSFSEEMNKISAEKKVTVTSTIQNVNPVIPVSMITGAALGAAHHFAASESPSKFMKNIKRTKTITGKYKAMSKLLYHMARFGLPVGLLVGTIAPKKSDSIEYKKPASQVVNITSSK